MMTMTTMAVAQGYVITWNNGPEDKYFCGTSYDEPSVDCKVRQNCRSGRDDECEGYDANNGIKCFAETPCDSKNGGGSAYVSHTPVIINDAGTNSTTNSSEMATSTTTTASTTPIAKDPSDHWFCGIGFKDANERCEVHCPYQTGCPTGEICYFGTTCDAHPPPPTRHPTSAPTVSRTESAMPSMTASRMPTIKPVSP